MLRVSGLGGFMWKAFSFSIFFATLGGVDSLRFGALAFSGIQGGRTQTSSSNP